MRRLSYSRAFALAISLSMWALVSCGLPNPLEQQTQLVTPISVDAYFDGSQIRFSIVGLNSTGLSPDFSGYNIYFDRSSAIQNIEKKLLLPDRLTIPTVEGIPQDTAQALTYNISLLRYTNYEFQKIITETISLQDTYFFEVKSYSRKTQGMSAFDGRLFEVHVPRIVTSMSLSYDSLYNNDGVAFQFSGGSLVPSGDAAVQALGYYSNFFARRIAPLSNYVKAPVPMATSSLYYLTSGSNFVKIYLQSYDGSKATFSYGFLQGSPLL